KRGDTAGLVAPKTSPTLVEFQNKNAPLPDWRIQLQNAVQQRKSGQAAASPQLSMSVATAAEPAPVAAEPAPPAADPRVANALAPFSMRFGAGLFDLIIAGFVSMLVLSPLAFSAANWWTISGVVMALGTFAVVTFVYMTACLGFFGKTMGMRLFSLELVDAVENEYPTLRQAAV